MPLKSFIIQEELNSEHAERFLLFQERYHTQVLLDLKKTLESVWTKLATSLARSHKIKEDDLDLALLQNPKVTGQLSVEDNAEKIVSTRYRDTIEVSPSVKIPLLYKKEARDLMVKEFLTAAEGALKKVTDDWKEIFHVEKRGRSTPWFKIVKDPDELRLQLSLTSEGREMYKTLYSVRVEYGRSSSKLRDFDRVYLVTLI